MTDVLTRVKGKPITVRDVVDYLKVTGHFRNTIYQLIEREVVSLSLKEMALAADNEELDRFIENKRLMMGLSSAVAMDLYCRQNGIKWEEWRQYAADEHAKHLLQRNRIDDQRVLSYFEANKQALRMICLARIVSREELEAADLADTLRKSPEDFARMARDFSVESNTRIAGGYVGCFKKGMLPPEIDAAVFAAPVKTVLGPFRQNDCWVIYKVEEEQHAQLTASLKKHIRDKLFFEWLRDEVVNVRTV